MRPRQAADDAAPTIETERLVLRAHRATDLDACAAMWADSTVTRYIGGVAFSREETWGKILRYGGLWALLGYGYWVLEEKATMQFVGEVGFADFKRKIEPPIAHGPEMGWILSPRFHGRGYANEAIRAALDWRDGHIALTQTVCLIAPANAASIGVAVKNGFVYASDVSYKGQQTSFFTRTAKIRAVGPYAAAPTTRPHASPEEPQAPSTAR